jgi:hypothetical protein
MKTKATPGIKNTGSVNTKPVVHDRDKRREKSGITIKNDKPKQS